jgi:sec-independent protein translocase protein TatA
MKRTDMLGDLFDSPWKVLIVAVVLIVLFGSKKLPHAARSLGRSMRILKAEVAGLHQDDSDDETVPGPPPAAQLAAGELAAPKPDQQSQIDVLQQQIRDLQRASTMDPVTPAGTPTESRTSQPS